MTAQLPCWRRICCGDRGVINRFVARDQLIVTNLCIFNVQNVRSAWRRSSRVSFASITNGLLRFRLSEHWRCRTNIVDNTYEACTQPGSHDPVWTRLAIAIPPFGRLAPRNHRTFPVLISPKDRYRIFLGPLIHLQTQPPVLMQRLP